MIDVLLDIILPELGSSVTPGLPLHEQDARLVPGGAFLDDEARFIRAEVRNDRQQTWPFPGGGALPDVTWAFNQATGARPDQAELQRWRDSADVQENQLVRTVPVDGADVLTGIDALTGEPVFPINPSLPSLNRHPGIILVPVGLFPILGTITVFGGQQIVGVSATADGSKLLKVGDGACIRWQLPGDFSSDRHRTAGQTTAGFNKNFPGENAADPSRGDQTARVRDLLAVLEAGIESMEAESPPERALWLADRAARHETLRRLLLAGEFPGFTSAWLKSLYIEQADLPARGLVARPPIEDELSDHLRPRGFAVNVGGMRPTPVSFSSIGLDLLGAGVSIVEDVVVRGFRNGAGIQIRPRAYGSSAQVAYYNQIRHTRVESSHTAVAFQLTMSWAFDPAPVDLDGDGEPDDRTSTENAPRVPGRMYAKSAGPNSTVFFDCTFEDFRRVGLHIWGATAWFSGCTLRTTFPDATGAILRGRHTLLHRCTFRGGKDHIVMSPPSERGVAPLDPSLNVATTFSGSTGSHHNFLRHNRFFDRNGQETQPSIRLVEFPTRIRNLTPAEAAQTPYRLVDAWDASHTRFIHTMSLDATSPAMSPQTTWTSTNLLSNTRFHHEGGFGFGEAPTGWYWEVPGHVEAGAVRWRIVDLDEPQFTGPVVEVFFEQPWTIRLVQVLNPAAGEEDAWALRSKFRGRRLVGGCQAWASAGALARTGFRVKGSSVRGRETWRLEEWLFLTSQLPVRDFDYANVIRRNDPVESPNDFPMEFFMEVRLPLLAEKPKGVVVRLGAPQVNLGPDLLPVGPGPATNRMVGALKLLRGFEENLRITLSPDHQQGASLIAHVARLEGIHIESLPLKAGVPIGLRVERHGAQGRSVLADLTLSGGHRDLDLAPVELERGDLLVASLLGGAKQVVDVYLQTVHSQVV